MTKGKSLLMIVVLVSFSAADASAGPRRNGTVAVVKNGLGRAWATKDLERRQVLLDRLAEYLERQIERREDEPALAAELRVFLIRVYAKMDEPEAAREVADELLAKYRRAVDEKQFRVWLALTLKAMSFHDEESAFGSLAGAAMDVGIEDVKSLDKTIDHHDRDGDGVEDRSDICHKYDDRKDSDGDGVPDGCDVCWGHPDDRDEDGDGFPDGCDHCPGKSDFDQDLDDVPSGCDNCPADPNPMVPRLAHDQLYDPRCECDGPPFEPCCGQPDEDNDGQGDPCDSAQSQELRVSSVSDRAGNLLQSLAYNEFGDVIQLIKWDGEQSGMMVTTYEYDAHRRQISFTSTPLDGTAPPRTTRVFYDQNGRTIGSITEGDPDPRPFRYTDDRGDVIKVTTATDPPEKATILERFERDDQGRLLKHEKRLPDTERLEVVVSKQYVANADGSREIVTRTRVDEDSEKVTIEGFEKAAYRPAYLKEYPEPVSPRGGKPTGHPLVTRYEYDYEPGASGAPYRDWKVTIHPSGEREVRGSQIFGKPHTEGSTWVHESYTSSSADPTDDEKQNWTRRASAFFPSAGYEAVEERYTSGEIVTYERDPNRPAFVLARRVQRPTEDGVETTVYRLLYDEAGRVSRETIEDESGIHTNAYEYDYQGRLVVHAGTDKLGTIERHTEYDAYDKVTTAYVVARGQQFAMVLPDWQVEFRQEDESTVMHAYGWGGSEGNLGCLGGIMDARVAVDHYAVASTNDWPATLESVGRPEFAQRMQRMGASEVIVSEPQDVALCGRLKGTRRSVELTDEDSERSGHVVELIVRDNKASLWAVHVGFAVEAKGEPVENSCLPIETIEAYVGSFCPAHAAFNLDDALLAIRAEE